MDTVGERLQRTRERRVLSQSDLATASGVPKVTISRVENGHQAPRPATVRKLAAALGVTAAWLMHGDAAAAAAPPAPKPAARTPAPRSRFKVGSPLWQLEQERKQREGGGHDGE